MQTSLLEKYWYLKILDTNMEENLIYTKKDYILQVQEKRREFVLLHFKDRLSAIFKTLKEDATKMRSCHREISFELPDHFDIDKTENILTAFFTDIGYKVLTESRKPKDSNIIPAKITFTLT